MVLKIAMTLHHHLHSPLQKNLWSSNAGPMLFLNSSVPAPCRHPFWRGSLRQSGFDSVATATASCPIRGATVITTILHSLWCIISIGSWGRGLHSGRWRIFDVSGILLTHLLFFIGVVEDDDFAIIRCPKELAVEVTEESFG
jgi:hypothetical protein